MMKRSRILALLLSAALLLSLLSGCATPQPTATPEPTPAATSEPTPEPTPEPLNAPEIYAEAAERLSAAADLNANYKIVRELILPDFSAEEAGAEQIFREETERKTRCQGLGGEDPVLIVEDAVVMDSDPVMHQKLIYADGINYLDIKGSLYYSETKAEDFLAAQIPVPLLDASLFDTLEAEEQGEEVTILFSGATGAPSWAMPEGAELLEAAGSAVVSAEGLMSSAVYELRFRYVGVTLSYQYKVTYTLPEAQDLSGELPENTKRHESLDDLGVPMTILRARHLMRQSKSLKVTRDADFYIEAAASEKMTYTSSSMLVREKGPLIHEEGSASTVSYYLNTSSGGSYEADVADGVMTITYGDGETETVETEDTEEIFRDEADKYFPEVSHLKDAESKEVGDYLLIDFAGNDSYGLFIKESICKELFGDDNYGVLDNASTGYRTKTVEGYLAVERLTGLPTAMELRFIGIHTIEDQPCELDLLLMIGIHLNTGDAPGDILDEPVCGPEPEVKPTPVFYEVTDAEGHKMYLFGTIHIGDDRTAYLPQPIYDALAASDALAVEFDSDRFEEMIDEDDELRDRLMKAYYYTDGTSIRNHIDSDVYKQALDLMKVTGNYNSNAESLKPYLWSNSIELFYLSEGRGLSSDKGVEDRLLVLAREAGKEILDVESGEFQVMMITGFSDSVQEMLLSELCETSRSEYIQDCLDLYEAWCRGDEAELIELLAEMNEEDRAELDEDELALYDEYHQKMEVERNAGMLEVTKGYLQDEKTVFFAVGLAHLLGEGGLVQGLRDAGFTVTLIDTK